MNPSQPTTDFAAFVALDWADQKHAWASQASGQARVEYGELENTPEAIEIWASELEQRFGSRPIAVAWNSRGAQWWPYSANTPIWCCFQSTPAPWPTTARVLPFRGQERPQ